jgi:diguanylate cyclase (GGDEF)-like protein
MVVDYTFFYIESNIICVIVFVMMVLKELSPAGRQTKQLVFINICFSHIFYFISDIGWVQVLYDYIPRTRLTVSAFNIVNAVMLSLITGYWFVYVELSQGEKYIKSTRLRIYVLIPAMLNTLILLLLFLFFPGTVIDEKTNVTAVYYLVFLCVPIFYIVISCIRTFIRAFRRENYAVRGQYILCGVYPLMISIFGVIQTIWLSAPIFCFATTLMILYVYIVSLQDQVSIDDLTHLNNRTQLKKYIVGESGKPGGDKANRYILMIDLNKFKEINDQYGHVEGDYALMRAADALRSACAGNELKTFIARFGGDEFIIVTKTEDESLVRALCSCIKAEMIRLNAEAGAKYDLTASIGYSCYSGDIHDFQSALARADEALYEEKKNRK